jgi:hypothetical protein
MATLTAARVIQAWLLPRLACAASHLGYVVARKLESVRPEQLSS